MNSLYVIEGDGGGAASHVLTLASRLRETNVNPFIAFLSPGPSVEVARRLSLPFRLIGKKLPLDPLPVWKLREIVYDHHIDLVHSHTIRGNFYARVTALLCSKPFVSLTTVHSHIVDELKGKNSFGFRDQLLWIRERCLWRNVDHFICVSEQLRQRLLFLGVDKNKISVIENGVQVPDLDSCRDDRRSVRKEFGLGKKEAVVTTIGRLVPVKNHFFFLRAAKELSGQLPYVRFLIVGDGELSESLKKTAYEWGLGDRVIFAGWRNDIYRLLCATDIYVICSFVEGLNLSVLEAMAFGIPVVGTDVKGISNVVVDEKTGKLVNVDDVDGMCRAIRSLFENKAMAQEMGLKGRRDVERKYSLQAMVKTTRAVYFKVIESKKTRNVENGK